MDYTTQSVFFKIKKAARYARIYGPARTLSKIRGQYHNKKTYKVLPKPHLSNAEGKHVAIVGCGNFAFSNIAYYLDRHFGKVIRAGMDIDIKRAASLFEHYSLAYYTDEIDTILSDPFVDLIFISSNHSSHAEYAIRALQSGKSVHIEKPHVTNMDQLTRLCDAMTKSRAKVNLGFNRPDSRMGKIIKEALDGQTGPSIFNWFVAGHEIEPEHWYFKKEEGGRVLGNLCHWTDFIYRMIAPEHRYPITIKPTRWERSDCDVAVNYIFGDGSIAAITFSAKGHTFEGVRERFAAHRGNVIISMDDFKNLTVEIIDLKKKYFGLFRDHGHSEKIKNSYAMVRPRGALNPGSSAQYVWETGVLFLKTKQALEEDQAITLEAFREEKSRAIAPFFT